MTEVTKGAAVGAVIGAVDAIAKVVGISEENKTNVAAVEKKSKNSISKSKSVTNKKPKSDK